MTKYFFYIVVILNIGFLYTLIWDFVILNSRATQAFILLAVNVAYLLNHRKKIKKLSLSPFSFLIHMYIILLLVNMGIAFIKGSNSIFLIGVLIAVCFTFSLILQSSIYTNRNPFLPYIFLAEYMVVASVFVFLLLKMNIISLGKFQIPSTRYELFWGNLQNTNGQVFFPLHLIFVTDSVRDIPFFGDFGIFTGLCHEPHLATLFITPALFFAYGLEKNIQVFTLTCFAFFFMAGSVTNLIIIVFCLLIFLEVNFRKTHLHTLFLILSIFGFVLIISFYTSVINSLGLGIILTKLDSSNVSNEVSMNVLKYMYTPKTIFGSDIFIYAYNKMATDIGVVNFLLIVLSQVVYIYGCFKMLLSHNKQQAIMSIGLIYFFMHGLNDNIAHRVPPVALSWYRC